MPKENPGPDNNSMLGAPPRRLRWGLFLGACLVTLVALFYAEENWRGKRAWERAEKELLAKGARLDWSSFVPAPVPDDQNVFKAPNMQDWFVKGAPGDLGKRMSTVANLGTRSAVRLAELRVVPPGSGGQNALRAGDPRAPEQLMQAIRTAAGPMLNGAQVAVLTARPLDQARAADVLLEADPVPTVAQLKSLLASGDEAFAFAPLSFQATGPNTFSVMCEATWCVAADYLAATARFEPDSERIREALKRPSARMEGDYRKPYELPIPNFVAMRTVAQTLSQRAQCHLLLGQSEQAARELMLVRDLCRLLESPPDGKPMTLVAAMINVAISGLYTSVIHDGLRLGAWQEPQLAALQLQCARIDLLPLVYTSMEAERAAFCHLLATMKPAELGSFFASLGNPKASWWDRLRDPEHLALVLAPEGWIYQNRTTVAILEQEFLECLDLTNRIVFPDRCRRLQTKILALFRGFSPTSFLAAVVVPNAVKATENAARNQTLAHQAQIACALERYRLANGRFPETLDALEPKFLSRAPRDLIGGHPLHYHTRGNGFLLYSVGWDEEDDSGRDEGAEGDWVWEHRTSS